MTLQIDADVGVFISYLLIFSAAGSMLTEVGVVSLRRKGASGSSSSSFIGLDIKS